MLAVLNAGCISNPPTSVATTAQQITQATTTTTTVIQTTTQAAVITTVKNSASTTIAPVSTTNPGGYNLIVDFKLGDVEIGGEKLSFEFPMEDGPLYAFHLFKWKAPLTGSKRLFIYLLDSQRNLIDSGRSICDDGNPYYAFGSIPFDVDRSNVGNVKYFSVSTEDC